MGCKWEVGVVAAASRFHTSNKAGAPNPALIAYMSTLDVVLRQAQKEEGGGGGAR